MPARSDCVGNGHAVDDVERIDASDERRRAADLNLATAAGSAVVHVDRGTDDLALKRALQRRGRDPRQLFGVHRGSGHACIPTVDRGGGAGDGDSLELQCIALKGVVCRVGRREDSLFLALVAQGAGQQRDRPAIHPNAEFATLVGAGADLLTDHRDGGVLQGRVVPGGGDTSRHFARLRDQRGREYQKRHCHHVAQKPSHWTPKRYCGTYVPPNLAPIARLFDTLCTPPIDHSSQ